MTDAQVHRGPDAVGYLETPAASIGLGRLKIIDLVTGDQPMRTADGLVALAFNGEVYNFRELRAELEALGHPFSTHSDTEVVLRAFVEWGPDAFARFNGMWGIAIIDLRGPEPKVVLSRDQFGIKPLYYAAWNGRIAFASEIKGLLADVSFPRQVNDQAMFDYLAYGLFDHTDATFFEGVRIVPPATYLVIDEQGLRATRYWQPVLAEDGPTDPALFRALFERAVRRHMVADVPVGTCLSGGLDSSSITVVLADAMRERAADAASLGSRLETFSAVFPGDPIDESGYIDAVLAVTDAESHSVAPTARGLLTDLESFLWTTEMPTISSAPYAMWCVMRMARDHVKVVYHGGGGDELLGGYDVYPYIWLRELWRKRKFATFLIEALRWRDVIVPLARKRLGSRVRHGGYDVPLLKPSFIEGRPRPVDDRVQDDLKRRLLQDFTKYSLPPLLRTEDHISMAFSIESRLPFLDQELVEAILRLPARALMAGGWNRRILREALRDALPEKVYRRRKKIGFTTPEFRWFVPEQAALEQILRSASFTARPYWDGPAVADAFVAACEGRGERWPFFWRAINVEIWMRLYIDPVRPIDPGRSVAPQSMN